MLRFKRAVRTDKVLEGCRRRGGVPVAFLSLALSLPGMSPSGAFAQAIERQGVPDVPAGVEIRRTTDGIPHLRAGNWRDLGMGVGYVQAQDALCTLAEAFVTFEGRRAWFFGAEARPALNSTFGRPKNIDLDFFFKAFADDTVVARYREQQPAELGELVDGFAAGYNRYLAEARAADATAGGGRECLHQPWVRAIAAPDIYRRMYAGQISAGYARFIPELTRANPARAAVPAKGGGVDALRARLAQPIGDQRGLGSNVLAFGRQATGEQGAVLFGNPHWYWGGPDRFYQMHLTIPGRLNVAGVAFLGIPVIMLGFNEHVAWSHTVSEARRFGLFDLALDPADPTRYRVDGRDEVMTAREVRVDVRGEAGAKRQVSRVFYQTRFGPVVDLGAHDAAFGWGRTHAIAIRDVNAGNFRIFSNFFHWNRAASLDEFIAIQRREAAVPWVNTVAIGRGDGRVWYGDVGAVPNVPDSLRENCSTPLARGFARIDPLAPLLDASRSACDWRIEPTAMQPGAMPAASLPGLVREDYVANMNDSYWLSNVHQPLEGFPSLLGGERGPLELRGRLGHRMALELLQAPSSSADALSRRVMDTVLVPRAYSAELFKDELLEQACATPMVEGDVVPLAGTGTDAATRHPRTRMVDVSHACEVLRRWSNRADAADRGALLWDAFWARLRKLPSRTLYAVPFSSDAPLDTPRSPRSRDGNVARALATAVLQLEEKRVALDAPLASRRFADSGGQRLPMYGGCPSAGYFVVACSADRVDELGPNAMANSYLQVVHFGAAGVEAHTLLAHGQDEVAVVRGAAAVTDSIRAPVARYARKDWLRFPFRESDIAVDPGLTRIVLKPLDGP